MSDIKNGEQVNKRAKYSEEMEAGQRETVKLNNDEKAVSETDTPEENGGLTPAFVDQYHVVKHIMEYLKFKDVLEAGVVNKQWAEIARIVRKQRKNLPYTVMMHPYLPHHKLAFEYFNGGEVSEEATELVQSGKNGYHPYKPRSYTRLQFVELLKDARAVIRKCVGQAYDEPQMIVSFGTSAFDGHLMEEHAKHYRKVSKERLKIVLGGIQNSIPCISSFSCGVIGNVSDCQNKSLEMEKMKFPCLSSLAIPKVSGLKVKLFTITKEQNRATKGRESPEICKELLGIEEDTEGQLKGIMLLHKVSHRTSSVVEAVSQYLRLNPHVALAGGVHESVLISGVADDTIIAGGMLIYGSDNVRVSSVALYESKMSANNTRKLEQLKASMLPGEQSFAFMFACNGRGRHMHGRPNVESDMFNSLFPMTPMMGAFTLGEYCHEVYTRTGQVDKPPLQRIDFAYTTAFLVVSYKHPVEVQEAATTSR